MPFCRCCRRYGNTAADIGLQDDSHGEGIVFRVSRCHGKEQETGQTDCPAAMKKVRISYMLCMESDFHPRRDFHAVIDCINNGFRFVSIFARKKTCKILSGGRCLTGLWVLCLRIFVFIALCRDAAVLRFPIRNGKESHRSEG